MEGFLKKFKKFCFLDYSIYSPNKFRNLVYFKIFENTPQSHNLNLEVTKKTSNLMRPKCLKILMFEKTSKLFPQILKEIFCKNHNFFFQNYSHYSVSKKN